MQTAYIHPSEVLLPGYPILLPDQRAAKMEKLRSQSRFLRIFLIIDAVFLVLWTIFYFAFIFAVILVFIGYHGVKSYKRSWASVYGIYLLANIAVRVAWLVKYHMQVSELILVSVGLGIMVYIFFLLVSFIYTLTKMPREDVHVLRACESSSNNTNYPVENQQVYYPGGDFQSQQQPQPEPFHLPPSYTGPIPHAIPAIPLQVRRSYPPPPQPSEIPTTTLPSQGNGPSLESSFPQQSAAYDTRRHTYTSSEHEETGEHHVSHPTHTLAEMPSSPVHTLEDEQPPENDETSIEISSPLLSPHNTYIQVEGQPEVYAATRPTSQRK